MIGSLLLCKAKKFLTEILIEKSKFCVCLSGILLCKHVRNPKFETALRAAELNNLPYKQVTVGSGS